ncbi:MAG: condensation domain-containing protein, partial [Acidobacteriota bacterium]
GATAAADTLRRHLADSLPDYMVPAIVVHLDALPLTPNGKVDRKALPAPDVTATAAEYEAPDGEVESMLATLWAEILDAERVGRRAHFVELGGHSLLATRMLARLRDTFDVVLPVRAVFESPTLAEMAQAIHDAGRGDDAALPPITPVGRDEPLPVSSAQRRLWFLDRLDPGSTAYVLSAGLRVLGPLDHGPLIRAVDRLVARHESLRTRIVDADSEPVQIVDPPSTGRLVVVDLGDRSADAALAEARRLAAEENQKPMDLAEGPLLRTTLVRLADDDHALLVSIHHIVSDGWSMGILFRELSALYDAAVAERADDLPALPLQYGDFAAWEQQHLVGDVLDRQLDFWRRHLAGAPTALELPTDRPRPVQQTFVGTRHPVRLSPELSTAIDTCSRELGATPFMTLLAAWSLLLGRHAGQDDVVVGTPVAHREHVEIEHLIGFFANTLALRTHLDAGSFAELVGRVRRTTLDALSHQDLPFEKLIGELDVERNLAHSPIFQVMFSMQNLDGIDGRLGAARLASLDADYSRSQFDINLLLSEGPIDDHPDAAVAFGGFMEYNTDLFDAATIEALGRRWVRLLEQVTADPHRPLAAVDLLGADERTRVLDAWNDTARELPALTLHRAIAERAAVDPERAAVTGLGGALDGVTWTYGDLLTRARRIAHHLHDAGARPDQLVGVLLHRSPDALAVLLGILEAGAGYLPLDPDYPSDRLAYMIESSGATLVVTDGELPDSTGLDALATSRGVRSVRLAADAATIAGPPTPPLDVAIDPEHLAYAIYTSGSTGLPKGVQIPHRAIVNFLRS